MMRAVFLAVIAVLALVLTFALASLANAVDLGSHGRVYSISEPDFLVEIQDIARKKVESGEWRRLEAEARERGKQYIEAPPAIDGLRTATLNRVRQFDPSIALAGDIQDAEGRVIFPAGTVVNPADISPFPGALLYLNGADTRQVALAERLIKKQGDRLKVVLVDGSPAQLMRKWLRPVYFDQAGAGVRRFRLDTVPALITQKLSSDRFLTIEELKP